MVMDLINDNINFDVADISNFLEDTMLLDSEYEIDHDELEEFFDNEEKKEPKAPLDHDPLIEFQGMNDLMNENEQISELLELPTISISENDQVQENMAKSPMHEIIHDFTSDLKELDLNKTDIPNEFDFNNVSNTVHVRQFEDAEMMKFQASINNSLEHLKSMKQSPPSNPSSAMKNQDFNQYAETMPSNEDSIPTNIEYDESDNMIKFQKDINNSLESLLHTMKKSELSRLSLATMKELMATDNQFKKAPKFLRRNSLNSPMLSVFHHKQNFHPHESSDSSADESDIDNNKFMNQSCSKPTTVSKASRRLSIGKPMRYRSKQNRRNSLVF